MLCEICLENDGVTPCRECGRRMCSACTDTMSCVECANGTFDDDDEWHCM